MSNESKVTVERIQDFLLKEELEKTSRTKSSLKRPLHADCKVTALGICAAWDQAQGQTLTDISFEVFPGELLAIIGPVGSGKSSLLMALLQELPLVSGILKVDGKVAYVSQQPWVFSASVRQNIIFGQEFDMPRYQRAIKAAALAWDLEMMPDGDQTLIGERGASLSGGQKARVSLARAIYFDADIYLLDDPLSAVDTAVGRHIFEKCINGVLRSKPRILVTHQLQFLKQADKILILKDGRTMEMGMFDQLAKHGVDFAALLKRDKEETVTPKANGQVRVKDGALTDDVIHEDAKRPAHYLSKSFDPKAYTILDDTSDLTKSLINKSRSKSLYGNIERSYSTSRSQMSLSRSVESITQHNVGSMISLGTLNADIMGEYVAPLHEEEKREAGSVTASVYVQYFYYGAGVFGLLVLILFNLAAQISYILCDWWLSYWSTQEEMRHAALLQFNTELHMHNSSNITVSGSLDVPLFLYIYLGITISVFIFGLLRALLIFRILVTAAQKLHNNMFHSILRCPILFFDTNPVGRVLNRFSKDIGLLDETLPLTMFDFIQCGLTVVGIVLVAGVVNPWVFIPTTPLCILFIIIRRYFLATSRDIKRLEATTRSPVFTHVSASLQGLHTIRALRAEDQFIMEFHRHQDLHSEAWSLFLSTSRWLAVRLDWLCAMFVTAVAFSSVIASDNLSGGLVGLTVTYAISLMGLFQWAVRQSAEVENQMTSVERVLEYSHLKQEASLESEPGHAPPTTWPAYGIITGENATFKYSEEGQLVLKGLDFCVRSEEKVGIIGRTGAGKSSLISMLFRMSEPEGLVQIDAIDIKSIGLHDLRKKISIIPQDPVLFTGSVRRNIDPFSLHSDESLWKSLEEVQLKEAIEDLQGGLEASVSEGGINFSVGQRQLLCLARAILRKNKILVIDEATANVDPRTDALIQQTIRQKFQNCTVLTIAHRLHTIMDSDRVMVLGDGKILEYDEPYTLLQTEESAFYQMVQQTGEAQTEHLLDVAREAYLIRNQPDPNSIIPDSCRSQLTSNVESTENGTTELTSIV